MVDDTSKNDSIQLILTENCTLACKYCYEVESRNCKKPQMTFDTLHKSIDYFVERAKDIGLDRTHFVLFGGEPMLCPELIIEFYNYAQIKEKETGISITGNIITNGTIYNEELLEEIYKIRGKTFPSIQFSIDGIPESQNINRPLIDPNSKISSAELIAKNVEKFHKFFETKGINKSKLAFHSCISHESLPHLNENFLYCAETLNLSGGSFMTVLEDPNFSLDDIPVYEEQMGLIYESAERLNWPKFPVSTFGKHAACDAGWRHFCIGTEGDIFGCSRFYFNTRHDPKEYDKFKIGNVYDNYSDHPLDDSNNILVKAMRDFSTIEAGNICKICLSASYERTGMLCSILNPFLNRLFEIGKDYSNSYNKNHKSKNREG